MAVRQLVFVLAFTSVGAAGFGSSADEPGKAEAKSPPPNGDADDAERKRRGEFLKDDSGKYPP